MIPEQKRKLYPSDLTNAQWDRIKPLLPERAKTGRKRKDDREVINGMLYVLSTGCRWADMPHDIETSPATSHRRMLEYQQKQVWQKIQRSLMQEAYQGEDQSQKQLS